MWNDLLLGALPVAFLCLRREVRCRVEPSAKRLRNCDLGWLNERTALGGGEEPI
jgi:hypothetical protein